MNQQIEVGGTMTFTISSPENFLLRKYGAEITQLHNQIEEAIARGSLETEINTFARYIDTGVWIEDYLRPLFERMYVLEGGWSDMTFHHNTVRLYVKTME